MTEEELINKAFAQSPDIQLVLKAAINLFDSRVPESRNCTIVSAKCLTELFQALKLDELAGYVMLERPGYVAEQKLQ